MECGMKRYLVLFRVPTVGGGRHDMLVLMQVLDCKEAETRTLLLLN